MCVCVCVCVCGVYVCPSYQKEWQTRERGTDTQRALGIFNGSRSMDGVMRAKEGMPVW